MKPAPHKCDPCNRGGGVEHELEGVRIYMCAECWPSEFRRGRVLERAREATS